MFDVIGVARRGARAPSSPNWNTTNDKNLTKNTIASSGSVSFSNFAYNSTKKKLNGAYFSQKINGAYLQSLVSTVNFLKENLELWFVEYLSSWKFYCSISVLD